MVLHIARWLLLCMGLIWGHATAQTAGPVLKRYLDTSLTSCPAGEKLKYFYYYQDIPERHGSSWCGAAQADLDWANRNDPHRWRIPYLLEACVAGEWWSYSHALLNGTRHYSPPHRSIAMVCSVGEPDTDPPLGCAYGSGGFVSCPGDDGVPPTGSPPNGTPTDGGPNPNTSSDSSSDGPVDNPPPPPPPPGSGHSCRRPPPSDVANPIYVATGNKHQREVDYVDPHGLSVVRNYNSSLPGWVHNFSVRVLADASKALVVRPDGRAHVFTANGTGAWVPEAGALERLTRLAPSGAGAPTWEYQTAGDTFEYYDAQGLLMRIARRGQTWTLQRDGALIRSVTGPFGRSLQFAYDASRRLAAVTTPEGTAIQYGYDAAGRLAQATYPDGTTRQYLYENATYPVALTGIIDERGVRYASWAYDAQGRAVSSEYAGGVDRHQLFFGTDGSVTVTDPLGTSRVQRFGSAGPRKVFAGQSQPCANCSGDAANQSIDPVTGLIQQSRDFLGVTTLFTNDTQRKLPLSITEAAGRAEQRQVQIQWHPSFRLPVLVTEQGRSTAYSYDSRGNKLTETITDTATGQTRSWSWTYNAQSLAETMTDPKGGVWRYGYDSAGNRSSVKDPLNRETSYTHDAAGRILTQTDPGGLTTTYRYDLRGRLLQQTRGDETTSYSYTPSGQLQTASLPNGHQVSYSYDAAQRLIGATDNRGATISYSLDAAGNRIREEVRDAGGNIALITGRVINNLNRVAALQGAAGQSTQIGYDANGEPVSQTDPLNQTTRQTLDGLRRSTATTFPDNTTAAQSWNSLDQLTQVTDPKGVATQYSYNAFGEVMSETSPDIGTISYTRDANGDITQTQDAKGQINRIERDALGRPTAIQYAADHQSFFSYDAAGFVSRIEDQSGTTTYTRDAQGRILTKTQTVKDNPAAPSSFALSYTYTNGDLTSIGYPSGMVVTFKRTAGRITGIDVQEPPQNKNKPGKTTAFVTGLAHTALGQPKAWRWSNGAQAQRSFDMDGRMSANEFAGYSYDAAGRITGITQQLWAQRPSGELYQTPVIWAAGYDSRNRLVSFSRAGAQTTYSYDANSNRLTAEDTQGSAVDLEGAFEAAGQGQSVQQASRIEGGSNRLLGFTQSITRTQNGQTIASSNATVNYQVDANGAMTSDGLREFEYDQSNRLAKVRILKDGEAASIGYLHNALGQRIFRSEPQVDQTLPDETKLGPGFVNWLRQQFNWLFTQGNSGKTNLGEAFVYGDGEIPNWALIGSYDNGSAAGKGRYEFIWLPTEDGGAIPVGIYRAGKLYAIHADHLGTPRLITDSENKAVWQWPYGTFGSNKPMGILAGTTDASGNTTLKGTKPVLDSALRFPGQVEDAETGLFYNYFRTYQPGQGRYTQADPIGLDGGLNRFGYSLTPLQLTDPMGLTGENPTIPIVWGPLLFDPTGRQPVAAAAGAGAAPRSVPNPWGSRGGPAHRATVQRRIEELQAQGHKPIGGGKRPEELILTPGGTKSCRRPDITTRSPDGTTYRENVGRSTLTGDPIARERRALDDLEAATGQRPGYTPYDK